MKKYNTPDFSDNEHIHRKVQDLKGLVDRYGIIGAAAGSIFVFKGKYKAVLVQYPTAEEKREIVL